ncbi:hypothetical protein [Streptomyces fragilis]|uniref:Uncharacterized protein n=1 Tax=Streptomyces fragilis TaxID=67301 RepID=A0ABV2YNG2_9ACTN|nr:hypothetical protein [Streptomyces fragilis]
MLLDPEKAMFVPGATPLLLLSGAPFHEALPPLATEDRSLPTCEGWSIVPKHTLCVVDGPGEHGAVIPSLAALVLGEADMSAWCGDAARAGGAVVLSVERLPEVVDVPALMNGAPTRGGFMALIA